MAAIHTTINRSAKEEWFDRLLYARLVRRSDATVFVCQTQADYWAQRFPGVEARAHVIYNGVDTRHYAPPAAGEGDALRQRLGVPDAAVLIACIAGFRPEKGHLYLLEALTRLPDAHLVLAGDGPERQTIEAAIGYHALDDRVHLLG